MRGTRKRTVTDPDFRARSTDIQEFDVLDGSVRVAEHFDDVPSVNSGCRARCEKKYGAAEEGRYEWHRMKRRFKFSHSGSASVYVTY